MFIETITQAHDDWKTWSEKLRVFADPPEALIAAIAWESGDGQITQLNVWDNPAAVGDMFMERTAAVIEELGEPASKPQRHGPPVSVYLRGGSAVSTD